MARWGPNETWHSAIGGGSLVLALVAWPLGFSVASLWLAGWAAVVGLHYVLDDDLPAIIAP